jgi:2-hydroxy-3-keto-5-methylthiopentenyl-1-phosphate phosphatase
MEPIIRAVLSRVLPEEADSIPIIANGVSFTDPSDPNSEWKIIYRHPESGHGHDKSKAILPYRDLPGERTLFFCGDGVSDLSAARHADVLFTKEMANGDSDLMSYCKKEGIPHVPFTDL